MTTIKFRAWDKKKMIDWESLLKYEGNGESDYDLHAIFSGDEHMELMQFTGLLDKNGKEIYEGDIVDCQYGKPKVIKYSPLYGFFGNFPEGLQEEMCTIIGNIYQNKELLK